MVMLTGTAITSEKESGTMEMLLSTPLKPTEIILGKVIPYILLGYLQLTSVLIFSKLLINIPFEGNFVFCTLQLHPFIIANLMVGMIFSTLAYTPMQAMQLSIFYQLPAMFLSDYIFSFYGMPSMGAIFRLLFPNDLFHSNYPRHYFKREYPGSNRSQYITYCVDCCYFGYFDRENI